MGVIGDALKRARIAAVAGTYDGEHGEEIAIERIVHETPDAVLLRIDGSDEWVPKSQLEYADAVKGVAVVSNWFAAKQGWADALPSGRGYDSSGDYLDPEDDLDPFDPGDL